MDLTHEAPHRKNAPGCEGLLQDLRLHGAVSAPFVVSEIEKAGQCLPLESGDMSEKIYLVYHFNSMKTMSISHCMRHSSYLAPTDIWCQHCICLCKPAFDSDQLS